MGKPTNEVICMVNEGSPVGINIDVYSIYIYIYYIIEGSLEVKLPTIWTVEKQR